MGFFPLSLSIVLIFFVEEIGFVFIPPGNVDEVYCCTCIWE